MTADILATVGDLDVRLSADPADIAESQALRYEVFYKEMNAQASPEMERLGRDFDDFDPICDHLLAFDHSTPLGADGRPKLVGTYRLLRQEVAQAHGGFYTEGEFDISPLREKMKEGYRFLELGRSCTHKDYRSKAIIELLWKGIMAYVARHDLDVMFGCASFETTDPTTLDVPLSFLYHECRAPEGWRVMPVPERHIEMNRLPPEQVSLKAALRGLPPLIKGYIRAGAFVGEGAVIDHEFGTTDVLILFPVSEIRGKYREKFVGEESAS